MAEAELRDFEIHIRKAGPDGAYPVGVHVEPDDRRAEGSLRAPFSEAEVTRALKWMEQGLFDADYVREFGAGLFAALFDGPIKSVYDASHQSSTVPLRFRLITDEPAIARIPWELLYDPERRLFLGQAGPLVRGISATEATRPLEVKPPLRMLLIDAFPRGVLKVQEQVETAGIQRALQRLIRRRRVEVTALPHVTLGKLQRVLQEAADPEHPRPFHLLHFIGHGQHDPITGRTVLLFETEDGEIDEVDAATLLNILRPYNLKLVFLNACQTLQTSALEVAQGFAPVLLASGVPAVIGMQVTVLDEVAARFSHDFYAALASNRPVDVALSDARQLARGTRLRRKADLGIPVCYLRTENGRILELQQATRLSRETWRPWLRERATPGRIFGAIAVLIGLVSGLLGIVQFVLPWLAPSPTMDGTPNIAVADFGHLSTNGCAVSSQDARGLARALYEDLQTEIPSLLDNNLSEIWAPAQTGAIQGETAALQAEWAGRRAGEINADVIIYGDLACRTSPRSTTFTPQIYISDRKLKAAEHRELLGHHQFGSPIEVLGLPTSVAARQRLTAELLKRTGALANFLVGLDYYAEGGYNDARRLFETALADTPADDRTIRAMLYLFLGTTAGNRGDLAGAKAYYEEALKLDPAHVRARFNLAENQYFSARGDCESNTVLPEGPPEDAEGLREAARRFEQLRADIHDGTDEDMRTWIAFGLGRTYTCLSQALIEDRWADAERELKQVTAYYEANNTKVQDMAAEAYGLLGVFYLPSEGEDCASAAAKFRQAAAEFRKASQVSGYEHRLAYPHSMLGYIHGRLKEYDEADKAYDEAIRLDPNPENDAQYEQAREQLRAARTQTSSGSEPGCGP